MFPDQHPRSCQDAPNGVENPRGPEAVWMNVHELFTERMCFNFSLVPSQRRLVSRSVSLPGEVLRPRSLNYVRVMWDRHYFAVQLNGHNLGPIQLNVDTAPGPPSQGLPFFWTVSARRAQQREAVAVLPLLSPVMSGAECTCRVCQRSHTVETHHCVACPTCYTWVCREHVDQTPHSECPGCPTALGDFIGGAHHVVLCDRSDAVLADVYIKLNLDLLNKILQFYNAASHGPAVRQSTSRYCLGCDRIRNNIISHCVSEMQGDFFRAESIAHSLNNCCTFTSNRFMWHPVPIRLLEIGFIYQEQDTCSAESYCIIVLARIVSVVTFPYIVNLLEL